LQRTASGRQARLAAIIRDIQEGRGDAHWQAAMRYEQAALKQGLKSLEQQAYSCVLK